MEQLIYPTEHLLGDVLLPNHGNEWNSTTATSDDYLVHRGPDEIYAQQVEEDNNLLDNLQVTDAHVHAHDGNFAEYIVGNRYKRADIHQALGGQHQSGISTPSKYPVILCFTINQPETTGYYDANNPGEGKWIFSGEGQNHMTFTKGNLQLREHKNNGKRVFLFTRDKKQRDLLFEGEVEVEHVEVTGVANVVGVPRAAILFHLKRISLETVRVDLTEELTTGRKRKAKPTPLYLANTPQEVSAPLTPPINENELPKPKNHLPKKAKKEKNSKKTKTPKKSKKSTNVSQVPTEPYQPQQTSPPQAAHPTSSQIHYLQPSHTTHSQPYNAHPQPAHTHPQYTQPTQVPQPNFSQNYTSPSSLPTQPQHIHPQHVRPPQQQPQHIQPPQRIQPPQHTQSHEMQLVHQPQQSQELQQLLVQYPQITIRPPQQRIRHPSQHHLPPTQPAQKQHPPSPQIRLVLRTTPLTDPISLANPVTSAFV